MQVSDLMTHSKRHVMRLFQ